VDIYRVVIARTLSTTHMTYVYIGYKNFATISYNILQIILKTSHMCEDYKNVVVIFRFLVDFASSELMSKVSFFKGCKTEQSQRQPRSQGLSCPRPLKRDPRNEVLTTSLRSIGYEPTVHFSLIT